MTITRHHLISVCLAALLSLTAGLQATAEESKTDQTKAAQAPAPAQNTQQTKQAAPTQQAQLTPTQAAQQRRQQLLQRVYQMRARFDNDVARAENEARANVRLVTQTSGQRVDSPTVSGLRHTTNQSLARFEQQFRCLDVDLEATTGNTVVICGDNTGDISGTNVSAQRDIVTVQGGQP